MLLAHGIDLTAGTDLDVDHGLPNGIRVVARKGQRVRKIIVDWSGNEMNAEEYAAFLSKGKTGCHLFIDHEGGIYQFADLSHSRVNRVGAFDAESVWIVLQNKGEPVADPRVPRGTFRYAWGGRELPALGSLTEQLESLYQLVDLICESLQIEPWLPRRNEELITRHLSAKAASGWQGVLLASHLSSYTVSPGPGVLEVLDELEGDWNSDDGEYDEEEDTDLEGEEEELDEEAFDRAFPDA